MSRKIKSPLPLIKTLEQLDAARRDKRAVFCPWFLGMGLSKPKPAAFMMNLSGELLLRMFSSGMMIYKSTKK